MGDKLFGVPMQVLILVPEKHKILLDVNKERLEKALGFDKNNWSDISDLE